MNSVNKIDKQNVEDILSLTSMQEGMLYHYINNSGNSEYLVQLSLTISGDIIVDFVKKAWEFVVEANEMLRTVYRWQKLNNPLQIVLKKYNIPFNEIDISKETENEKQAALERIREQCRLENIDISTESIKVTLCKLNSNQYEMIVTNHHIIFDGWSNGIILKDFMYAYKCYYHGDTPVLPEKNKFKEYIKWYKSLDKEAQKLYWGEYLHGFENNSSLFQGSNIANKNIKSYGIKVSNEIRERVAKYSKNNKISVAALFYSIWGILLQKYSGEDDTVFGTTVSGRNPKIKDIEDMVGVFINTLPLRVTNQTDDIIDILSKVEKDLIERQEYESSALTDIKSYAYGNRNVELFDSIVVVENYPLDVEQYKNNILHIDSYKSFDLTNYNMTVSITTFKDIEICFYYNQNILSEDSINRLASHFNNILYSIVNKQVKKVSQIELLNEEEKQKLLYEFNDTYTDYPREKTIHELFEEQAGKTPDNIAVIFENKMLTYRELNEKSNRLARTLREKGVGPDSIVGIMVERSLEMIIGIIGILKAGGAYLPIDLTYPEDRIGYMLEDSKTMILLSQGHLLDNVNFQGEILDMLDASTYSGSKGNLEKINTSKDLAYIIYTSGSTGRPKGVMIEHKGVVNLIQWIKYRYNINGESRILQSTTYTFDVSVEQIFAAILNGAQLYLISKEDFINSSKFTDFMIKNKITFAQFVPSTLQALIRDNVKFDNLEILTCGGDKLDKQLKKDILAKGYNLFNHYGPTEITVDAITTKCHGNDGNIIGKAINNTKIYIVDKDMNLMPIGVIGEICISGEGLARGYINNHELTIEKFVNNPFIQGERMYRTGDLARWLPDGNIEFLGRVDHQVKIRGFRIELGEIESNILIYNGVREAIVVEKEDEDGSKYLCAYIVSDKEITTQDIRQHLLKKLPEYMIPSYFVKLDSMPLTSSGKIDRKALPVSQGNINLDDKYEAPRTDIEEKLCQIWEEVLRVEKVGINDNFFELGGHSLKATVLVSRIHKEFDIEIPLKIVFSTPTIKGLSEYIQSAEKNIYSSIQKVAEREYCEASSAQKRIFMLQQLDLNSTVYNIPAAMEVEGKLESQRLEYAVKALIERHESLRTYFETIDGTIVQRISKETNFEVEYVESLEKTQAETEIAKQSEVCKREKIDEILKKFVRAFDLSKSPLLRVGLIKVQSEKYILMFDMHHIISDGTSMGILINEFTKLYEGKELKELKLQYKDYAHWQNKLLKSEKIKKQEEYWVNRFSGEIPILNMLADYPRPSVKSFEGDRIGFTLDKYLTRKLNKLSKETGSTLYMLLLSAVNILLSRYSGQEDIVIGSPIAGRPHADLEGIIGMLVNTLPMRNEPSGEKNYEKFLKEVRENALKAYENQDYQFEELVNKLNISRDMSRNPLFDVMFVLQNMERGDIHLEKVTFKQYIGENKTSKFDLTIFAAEAGEEIVLDIEYSTKLFKKETVERMTKHFTNILNSILEDKNIRLKDIELLGEEEKHKLLNEFNNTYSEFPRKKTIHELFEEQAEKTPDNIAAVFEGEKLTYRELNQRANSLARTLRSKGIGSDSIVGIMVERSLEMIIGIMGILKAGGAYLPIDPDYPEDRVKYMLEDSKTELLLTQKHLTERISFSGEVLDLLEEETYAENIDNLDKINSFNDLAYVIYTSGSTGRPKGVMMGHSSVVNLLLDMQKRYPLLVNDAYLLKTAFTFDVSVAELFGYFMEGGKLVILTPGKEKEPRSIIKFIQKHSITHINFVPSMLNLFITDISEEDVQAIGSLKYVFSAGEKLTSELFVKFNNKVKAKLVNIYGPTETTYTTGFSVCKQLESDSIPIGRPLNNIKIYIKDKYNKLVPIGVPGELCVSGASMARGYLNNLKLTSEKFVENPFLKGERMYRTGDLARWLPDGNIEFIGRIDEQVKIRGFRIELGEIESNILTYSGVSEAAVVDREDEGGSKYLCAYVVSEVEIVVGDIRQYLLKKLPEYMVPSYFVQLESMPLTASGKVDRKSLPMPEGNINLGTEYEAPRNGIEEKLLILWQQILGVEKIGINDNFFELGGHSLRATVLASRIHKELDVEIPLKEIFSTPTIKGLSEYIQSSEKNIYSSIEKVPEREYYEASSAQKRMYMLQQFDLNSTVYNMPAVMEVEGNLNLKKVEYAVKALIQRHETLRTSFETIDGEIVQKINKETSFEIGDAEGVEEAQIEAAAAVQFEVCSEVKVDEAVKSFVRAFDLSKAPMLKVRLIKVQSEKYILMFDMHHIISDGVSISILISEFMKLYEGKDLSDLKLQYKDYSKWQNDLLKSDEMIKQEKYWLNKFSGEIPVLNMPTDYQRPSIRSFEGERIDFILSKELTKKLNKLGKETGSTLYMLMLSAVNILLSKYSGQEDIIVGSPIAGRSHADIQGIIGMFVNTLAMRNEPKGEKIYEEFLREVKENTLKAYENQDYPFEELVNKLNIDRDMGRNPLFDVMLVLQNVGSQDICLQEIVFKQQKNDNKTSKFDFTITTEEVGEEILLNIEYSTKLFEKETVQRMASHLINILNAIVEDRRVSLKDIELLGEEEKNKLLYELNNTCAEYPREKNIHELFEEQAERTPDNIAVVFDEYKLTYRELNERSNSLARILRSKGVKSDSIAAIMVEKSLEMIVGIIAIMKAGGAYLPIDPAYPEDRIKYMLSDSGTKFLLTRDLLTRQVEFNGEIINLDDADIYKEDISNLESINTPENLAYIIYTSGTTGKPKGAMIEHKNVVRLLFNDKMLFDFNQRDVWTMFHSFCFDFSVWEMYGALLYGGKLIVVPKEVAQSPESYLKLLKKEKVTILNQVPSVFYNLIKEEVKTSEKELKLRYIIFGGEALKPIMLKPWEEKYPDMRLINMYGITETTVHVTFKEIKKKDIEDNISNIGKPIPTLDTYIMDKNMNLLPVGVPGEICVGGLGVGRGYLNREELTKEKFVQNPYKPEEIIYRSGDAARILPSGDMEYLGRIDQQVKIRGFRIELREIESNVLTYEGVKEVVVIDREDENGNKYLCAYIVSDDEIIVGDIRQHLLKNLPEYMIPSYFVRLPEIPLTANGKVDRKTLPEPNRNIITGAEYEAPRNEVEEKLIFIWQEVLGVESVGINDNFFELGGHSLKATILVSRIHKELNVEIPLKEIFSTPTIKGIGEYIQSAAKNICLSIEKIEKRNYYEVSSAQKRMYMLQQFDLSSTVYNMPAVMEVEGKLELQKIKYAIKSLIERHEGLRTSFETIDGGVVQRISEEIDFEIEYVEDFEESYAEAEAETGLEVCRKEKIVTEVKNFVRAFDLRKAPLLRVGLIKIQPEKYILIFDMHHIISDGVSMGILISEFTKLYQGKELSELKLQYKDYSHWQNKLMKSDDMKKQEEYWLNRFSGEIPVLNMLADYQRPGVKSFEGDSISFNLSKELTKKLNKLGKETGSTLYMLLLSAVNILLSKYSGQEDIIVGSPIAGRSHADLEGIIGVFVNTLAMRNEPKGDKSYEEFLREVRNNALMAYEYQDYQFEELVDKLSVTRNMSRNPLFDVMFVLQNMGNNDIHLKEAVFKQHKYVNKTAKFDLTITAFEVEDEIIIDIEYCTKVFKKASVERMAVHLTNILDLITADRKISLRDIELLGEEEKYKLLYEFNDTYVEYPREKTIQELFEEQVERTPENIAVVFENEKLTYCELNQRANSLARTLRARGVERDSIVGIMVDRSLEMIVGIIGILKAGGAYLPIDSEYPEDRIKYIFDDSGIKLLLTQNHFSDRINFDGEVLDLFDSTTYAEKVDNIEKINTSKDLAYIIYTSGSTGRPKGVMIEQKSLINYISFCNKYYLESDINRFPLFTSISFDLTVTSIYMPLLSGNTICIYDSRDNLAFTGIVEDEIDIMKLTPAHLSNMKNLDIDKINFKKFIVGGEELATRLAGEIYSKFNGKVEIINEYGPTEATVGCIVYKYKEKDNNLKTVPIGKPINNTRIYIFDNAMKVVPIGIAGELWIAGEGLSRGYLNKPELSAERFLEDPFYPGQKMYKSGDLARWLPDGNIEFLGRIDHQVKVRGFRIELGEIESNLLTFNGIREVIVVDKEDEGGSKYLCAYLVSDGEVTARAIREHLLKKLPEYMVPSYFVQLESMPLTANGKVDRKALPMPEGSMNLGTEYEAPRSHIEEKLCRVWQEVLGVEKVGINDNFFELGGHSLKATVLISRLHKELDVEISLKEIFSSPTIKGLSEYIQRAERNLYSFIEKAAEREYYEASSAQKRMYMLQQFDLSSTAYNMPSAMEVEGNLDLQRLEYAINALIERHETLRTYFEMKDEEIVQKISKEVSVKVEYIEGIEEAQDEAAATAQFKICRKEKINELVKNFVRAFDLSKAPLLRAGLIKIQSQRYILMFDMHHIISDGVSMGILISEFMKLYEGQELKELKLQYKDYSKWQNDLLKSDELKRQEEYWLNRFSGEILVLNLRTDYQRPSIKSFEGDRIDFTLTKELTQKLNKFSKETGSTLYMLLLSAVNILLSKYSGQENIVIGSPIAGRRHTDLEEIIGIFVNTLAMKNEPKGEKTYEEFLTEVKENALMAYENQDCQFEELVNKLNISRGMDRNPLFDVMFILQNMEMEDINLQDVTFKQYKNENKTAKFDLTITAVEMGEEIALNIEYDTKLFKQETIERMAKYLVNILNIITADRKVYIKDIELLREDEKHKLLYEFNDTYAEYPNEKTIQELFEQQVEKTPDKTAVIFENNKLTYREFNEKANSLAKTLRSKGVGPDKIVAIMVERSLEMMVGIMAILKAGGAYLPIDPDYPDDRIKYILEDSKTKLLLTKKHLLERISFEGEVLDLLDNTSYAENGDNLEKVNTSKDLAYIIYTSGSTGRPKGVMIEHHSVINRLNWMQKSYKLQSDDIILQKTPYTFDVSVWELFWWSFYGASVCLLKPHGEKDPEVIMEAIEKNNITTMHFVPSMLSAFLEFVRDDEDIRKLSSIRRVFSSGEAINGYQVEMFNEKLRRTNNSKLINLYGPTEATVDVSYFNCNEGYRSENVPIGKPIDNIQLYVVDKNYKMQPVGIPGELCIAGVGLARGYLNNTGLTTEKFVDNPFTKGERMYRTGDLARWLPDGNIEFLGRIDHQVKIRGFRIELGEIEGNILAYSGVREAVVIDREDERGSKYLCTYLVSDNEIEAADIKQKLLKKLPEYMIPAYFIQLDKMPLTSNGKLDIKALPKPEGSINRNSEYEAPRNEIEEKICRVWQEILGLEEVGINDNFFDIGGDSIKAVRAVSRSGGKYSLVDLYNSSTIKKLSDLKGISNNSMLIKLTNTKNIENAEDVSLVCIPYGGGSAIVFKDLADSLSKISERFTLYSINLPGHDISNPSYEHKNIKDIAKLCVEEIKIKAKPPVVLYGHCVGSALTIEIARLLEQEKIPVKLVYMGGVFPSKFGMLTDKSRALDPWRAYSDEHIRDFLNSIGGFKQAMESEEVKFIMECFRNDVKLSQEYFYNNYKQKINFKIKAPIYSVVGGRDPLTKGYNKKYKKWSDFTKNEVRLYVIPEGDHYFTKNNSDELADLISKTINLE